MEKAKKSMWREEGRRKKLSEVLPLSAPLTINVEASSSCNLKCCYCIQSLSREQKEKQNFKPHIMTLELFEKIVDGCKKFEQKIDVLRISGLGEPLVNLNLEKMIKYANESGCFNKIMLFTNGTLLTPERSEKIKKAGGIHRILFDIQGLNEKDYMKYSAAEIDFKQLIDNIKYFYDNCKKDFTEVFIKVYRYAVKGREDEFFNIFNPIADFVSIDNIYEAFRNVDYSEIVTRTDVWGKEIVYEKSKYCPYPFFHLTINANGVVEACCDTQERSIDSLFAGDVRINNLYDIWYGENIKQIRKDILNFGNFYEKCEDCKIIEHMPSSDILDEVVEKLKSIY